MKTVICCEAEWWMGSFSLEERGDTKLYLILLAQGNGMTVQCSEMSVYTCW